MSHYRFVGYINPNVTRYISCLASTKHTVTVTVYAKNIFFIHSIQPDAADRLPRYSNSVLVQNYISQSLNHNTNNVYVCTKALLKILDFCFYFSKLFLYFYLIMRLIVIYIYIYIYSLLFAY